MKLLQAAVAAVMALAICASGAERPSVRRSAKVKQSHTGRASVRDFARSILVTDGDVVLPYILNAEGLRSRIHLTNLGATEADLELYFADDDGFAVEVDLKDGSRLDTVKVKIAAHGTATIETSGTGDNSPVWAFFDAGTAKIGASVSLDITENGVVWSASYSALHYADQRVSAVFDNTTASDCEISIVNVSDSQAKVNILVRDANGKEIFKTTATLPGFGGMGFTPSEAVQTAVNARGTVEAFLEPGSTGGVGLLSVQFFDKGGINFLPGFVYLDE